MKVKVRVRVSARRMVRLGASVRWNGVSGAY